MQWKNFGKLKKALLLDITQEKNKPARTIFRKLINGILTVDLL